MSRPHFQTAFTIFQLLLAGVLLWWVARKPQFLADLRQCFGQVSWGWCVLAVAAAGLSVLLHILRWFYCLRLLGVAVTFLAASRAFLASSFIGSFLAGGVGGDIARVALLRQSGKATAIAVSVVADRLCGLVSLAVPVLLFSLPQRALLSQTALGRGTWHFLLGYLGFSALLFFFTWSPGTEAMRRWLPQWAPARATLLRISENLAQLRPSARGLLVAVLISTAMLLLYFFSFWAVARGLAASVSLPEMFALLPLVEAATTIPLTPSGIGLREQLFTDQLAAIAGLAAAPAVAISMAGFLATQLWYMLGGLALLPCRKPKSPE